MVTRSEGPPAATEAGRTSEPGWWRSFFDDAFAELVLEPRRHEQLEATVAFLEAQLQLSPGATVFDQACGLGRLACALARRGHSVIGVDQSEAYLARARASAAAEGLACELLTGDAAIFETARPCDGGFNWWTSFGYDEEDRQSRAMLDRAFRSLKPGARFVLDYLNVPQMLRELRPAMVSRIPVANGDALVVRETEVDLARGTFEQTWTYLWPDGRRLARHGRTRAFMPRELADLFTGAGFGDVSFFGGVDGAPLGLSSPRCIVVGRKPA